MRQGASTLITCGSGLQPGHVTTWQGFAYSRLLHIGADVWVYFRGSEKASAGKSLSTENRADLTAIVGDLGSGGFVESSRARQVDLQFLEDSGRGL